MKRLFDISVALVALLLLSPVILLVALLIYLTDKGPVFFKQKRVGLNGKTFDIYKFRSMVTNASSLGGHQTLENDNRITKIGRVIRKTSVDELPQLLNVLLGDMSVVGPRPNVPLQREEYSEQEWDKRNSVQPGITGLAQAKGRSCLTPEQRTKYDLEYVDNVNLINDIKIILLTVKQIVTKGGN